MFKLDICRETVPDLETAKIEFDKICDFIISLGKEEVQKRLNSQIIV